MFMMTKDEKKVLSHLSRLYGTTSNNVQHYVEDFKAQSESEKKIMSVWQVSSIVDNS